MDPTLLATGGILAAIFGLLALTDSDDDDNEILPPEPEPEPEPEPQPEPEPEPELSEDGQTLTGTERDDLIEFGPYSDEDPRTVLGGDGNDTITTEQALKSIYGEDGDDVILIDSASNGLFDGGAGNDLIEIGALNPGNSVYGGEGDDTLNITDEASSEPNVIDAGAGDDVLNITAVKWIHPYDFGAAQITLGEGHDTLNVTPDLRLSDNVEEGDAQILLMDVRDFNPVEDQLNIFVDQEDREFVDHTIAERDGDTIITINYLMENNNGVMPTSATIQISGVQGIPADAINLIRGATA